MRRPQTLTPLLLIGLISGTARVASGKMAITDEEVPAERLLHNLESYANSHAGDPMVPYLRGRIEYLLFHNRGAQWIPVERLPERCIGQTRLAQQSSAESARLGTADPCETLTPALVEQSGNDHEPLLNKADHASGSSIIDLERLLGSAVRDLRSAIKASPGEPLFHLTLASALEEGAHFLHSMSFKLATGFEDWVPGTPIEPEHWSPTVEEARGARVKTLTAQLRAADVLGRQRLIDNLVIEPCLAVKISQSVSSEEHRLFSELCIRESALQQYSRAFDLARGPDLARGQVLPNQHPVAIEAAEGVLRLIRARGIQDADRARVADVEATLAAVRGKIRQWGESPIVFSLSPGATLPELVSDRTALFDLDGTGRPARWTWLQPQTGLLVWDPQRAGRIQSGRQLFGNVSFHMFWPDGYAALELLDDNHDGALAGDELAGLAAWFDRNGNGVSDPGEVVPVEVLGVSSIAVHPSGRDGSVLKAERGLTLRDGTVVPSWDWIAREVQVISER